MTVLRSYVPACFWYQVPTKKVLFIKYPHGWTMLLPSAAKLRRLPHAYRKSVDRSLHL
jgi:hypothetical protein